MTLFLLETVNCKTDSAKINPDIYIIRGVFTEEWKRRQTAVSCETIYVYFTPSGRTIFPALLHSINFFLSRKLMPLWSLFRTCPGDTGKWLFQAQSVCICNGLQRFSSHDNSWKWHKMKAQVNIDCEAKIWLSTTSGTPDRLLTSRQVRYDKDS